MASLVPRPPARAPAVPGHAPGPFGDEDLYPRTGRAHASVTVHAPPEAGLAGTSARRTATPGPSRRSRGSSTRTPSPPWSGGCARRGWSAWAPAPLPGPRRLPRNSRT